MYRQLLRTLKRNDFNECSLSGDDIRAIVELECYIALNEIRSILSNDDLSDEDCFEKIEKIVCLFEEMGLDAGGRHDF